MYQMPIFKNRMNSYKNQPFAFFPTKINFFCQKVLFLTYQNLVT